MRFYLAFLVCLPLIGLSQWTGNNTPTYPELIQHYKQLATKHKEIELYQMGDSDYGLPIYLCVINGAQDSLKTFEKARKSTTVLINNAIHPGEPDGVNACLIWLDEWIKSGKNLRDLPVLAIIPAYNVGGMMNRSSTSRANQDGPQEYGFRGNAQNLDLNRDFIKMDSKNMFTFAKIYQALNPDVFVDTHVSNGADYQYVLTLIAAMRERLAPSISALTYEHCLPEIERRLLMKNIAISPYVELKKEVPEDGITAFNDLPRYAMGYATLFNSLSFTTETHMLKAFPDRVMATKHFLSELIIWSARNSKLIEQSRSDALLWDKKQSHFKYNYVLSETKDSILFKGYEHVYKPSNFTGLDRLYYDRTRPYQKYIPYYKTHIAKDSVSIPKSYIVGAQCETIIKRLEANQVEMSRLKKDTLMKVNTLRVVEFVNPGRPYEGHYFHGRSKVVESQELIQFKKGDVVINPRQDKQNFIVSVLEPATEDSYFSWNFMDSYVQQKEYFSPYVFEDKAAEILKKDEKLRMAFEAKQKEDERFRGSSWDQLYFIYQHSEYFEPTFNRLPIMKMY